ncbi:hypothetical protein TgHK011_007633 [Trichoderma gracile]|nr:hypothetical protein TgHK011_007633 [Trichoderma gracile]
MPLIASVRSLRPAKRGDKIKKAWRCTASRTGAEATGLGKVSRESEACWVQRVAGDWLRLLGEANQDKGRAGTYQRPELLLTAHRDIFGQYRNEKQN